MDVVEDEDEGTLTGELLEHFSHREKQLFGRSRAAFQQLADRAALLATDLVEDLVERPERDPLAVRQTSAADDGRMRDHVRGELAHQPRLPNAGWPEDREQMARALT